jgi:hypothetical protein
MDLEEEYELARARGEVCSTLLFMALGFFVADRYHDIWKSLVICVLSAAILSLVISGLSFLLAYHRLNKQGAQRKIFYFSSFAATSARMDTHHLPVRWRQPWDSRALNPSIGF